MHVGVSSFAFGWAVRHGTPPLDERGLLAFAQRHGLSVMQLADNLPAHAMSADQLAALVDAARAATIAIELGARGLTEAHLETYLALCGRCGAGLLRFVVDAGDYEPSAASLRALLANAVPAIEAAQVTLALENHDRFTAADLRRLVEDAGSTSIGICLDTANSLGAGEGLAAVVGELAPLTVNMHVKDVTITRPTHQMGFVVQGCDLGRGKLPIAEAITQVRAAGRCHSVLLESWMPPGHDHCATVLAERASAELGIRVLKRWMGMPRPMDG
ncbi:MAG: TIM barrel protein [Luteitalea sp.]|nr:TIM barrel protein [Luteitalea sp.]